MASASASAFASAFGSNKYLAYGVEPKDLPEDLQEAYRLALQLEHDTKGLIFEQIIPADAVGRWQRVRPNLVDRRIQWIRTVCNVVLTLAPRPEPGPTETDPFEPDWIQKLLDLLEENIRVMKCIDVMGVAKCRVNRWQQSWHEIAPTLAEFAFWTDRYRKVNDASASAFPPRWAKRGDENWWYRMNMRWVDWLTLAIGDMTQFREHPAKGFRMDRHGNRTEIDLSESEPEENNDDEEGEPGD